MLVSLQSHTEVLTTLDSYPSLCLPVHTRHNGTNEVLSAPYYANGTINGSANGNHAVQDGKLFVASVSPQVRASLAATFGVTSSQAGNMIAQLLSGPSGLQRGGHYGSGFTWVVDTNVVREACLVAAADEVMAALSPSGSEKATPPGSEGSIDTTPQQPILTSACPGWICYAEKTHPYVLPHLSRLKSPQALAGTLLKSVLSKRYNIPPSQIWHLAIMPCFDKKLEASRSELTSAAWLPSDHAPVRDVDCVITARELLHLASARNISFSSLPRTPLPPSHSLPFPDSKLNAFLFPSSARQRNGNSSSDSAGTSGGYLHHILQTYQSQNPGSQISISRGRNADVIEYALLSSNQPSATPIIKMARYYGFRNIQNLVRRLKPAKLSRMPGARGGVSRKLGAENGNGTGGVKEYAYVEVMACPGGCTNGGGQIKVSEVEVIRNAEGVTRMEKGTVGSGGVMGPKEQKEWLGKVDEAYFSGDDDDSSVSEGSEMEGENNQAIDHHFVGGISRTFIKDVLEHWAGIAGVEVRDLLYTSYRAVESEVGKKKKQSDVERVAGLASSLGGGW